jgi:putative sigma-54 modulation protein
MNIIWKGRPDALVPAQRRKLEAKLGKLARLVDGREEREAHIILNSERHAHRAELTVHLRDHDVVGASSSPDLLTALTGAIDRVEKQVQKLRSRLRDTKRGPAKSLRAQPGGEPAPPEVAVAEIPIVRKVYRASDRANQKPLTIEEALFEMEDGRDYLVYRDAETGRLSVLLRRRDGNFDLVEA